MDKRLSRRILSAVLVIALCITMHPEKAMAAGATPAPNGEWVYDPDLYYSYDIRLTKRAYTAKNFKKYILVCDTEDSDDTKFTWPGNTLTAVEKAAETHTNGRPKDTITSFGENVCTQISQYSRMYKALSEITELSRTAEKNGFSELEFQTLFDEYYNDNDLEWIKGTPRGTVVTRAYNMVFALYNYVEAKKDSPNSEHTYYEALNKALGGIAADDIMKTANDSSASTLKTIAMKVSTDIGSAYDALHSLFQEIGSKYSDNAAQIRLSSAQEIKDRDNPEGLEKAFSKLLISVGDSVNNALVENGLGLETIIYGRVNLHNGSAVETNYYYFELADGNVYGVLGAMLYSVFNVVLYIGILIVAMWYVLKASFSGSTKANTRLKEYVGVIFISLLSIRFMPYIFDRVLYVKDLILRMVYNSLTSLLDLVENGNRDAGIAGLVSAYRTKANELYFADACEYLGVSILSFYYAFSYVATALATAIIFGLFPVFVLFGSSNKKTVSGWLGYMLGVVITPVIDSVLLFAPLLLQGMQHVPSIVPFIACMSVIPIRGIVRSLLGMGSSAVAEAAGIGTLLMGARAVAGLAKTVAHTAGTVARGAGSVAGDISSARMETQLAQAEMAADGYAAGRSSEVARMNEMSTLSEPVDVTYNDNGKEIKRTANAPSYKDDSHGGYTAEKDRYETDEQKILAKHATIDNFEDQRYKGLSHEQRAKMYKRRAIEKGLETGGKAFGAVGGGAVGGSIVYGATSFLSPNTRMSATALGIEGGVAVGGAVGGLAGRGAYETGNAVYTGVQKLLPDGQEPIPEESAEFIGPKRSFADVARTNKSQTEDAIALYSDDSLAETVRNRLEASAMSAGNADPSVTELSIMREAWDIGRGIAAGMGRRDGFVSNRTASGKQFCSFLAEAALQKDEQGAYKYPLLGWTLSEASRHDREGNVCGYMIDGNWRKAMNSAPGPGNGGGAPSGPVDRYAAWSRYMDSRTAPPSDCTLYLGGPLKRLKDEEPFKIPEAQGESPKRDRAADWEKIYGPGVVAVSSDGDYFVEEGFDADTNAFAVNAVNIPEKLKDIYFKYGWETEEKDLINMPEGNKSTLRSYILDDLDYSIAEGEPDKRRFQEQIMEFQRRQADNDPIRWIMSAVIDDDSLYNEWLERQKDNDQDK